ncbi:MAG: hypothetical protein ABI321_05345 [Polyangia bacterium]
MHNVSRRVLLLPLAAVSLGACATTHTVAPTPAPIPRIVASRCRVRERALAPVSRHARLAALTSLTDGLAIVWVERADEHDALRLLVVDPLGAPRSPSAEVADRSVEVSAPSIAKDDAGYVVSWSEETGRFQRAVDGRGRPLGDVGPSTTIARVLPVEGCARKAKLMCATAAGPLELPVNEEPLARAPSGATVSLGNSGLRLWQLDCN